MRPLTQGFRGLLCIHSANDAKEDVAAYATSGAHVSVGKGTRPKEMVDSLKESYVQNILKRAPASPFQSSPVMSPIIETSICRRRSVTFAGDLDCALLGTVAIEPLGASPSSSV